MRLKRCIFVCIAISCLIVGFAVGNGISEDNEIFIQEGSQGTFVMDDSGNYTLTIKNVIPYTIYFTDRPLKDSGFAPMDKFISEFDWGPENPPNAAIMIRESDEVEDIVICQLTSPQYDAENAILEYSVSVLSEYESYADSDWFEQIESDESIPESFGQVILVIDGCPCVLNYNSCGPAQNGEDYPWHDYCNSQKFKWYKCNCDWDGLCCSKCYI